MLVDEFIRGAWKLIQVQPFTPAIYKGIEWLGSFLNTQLGLEYLDHKL
ncbi:MAG: hypothetical protein HY869_12795 [Chloroflexi bacterium]|nr:hypothetical protein [Chloroflexota bacterium]